MKKSRFLVLVLAVAIMLVGAGYAWWTETVTISSNVDTGVLDVDIIKAEGGTKYWDGDNYPGQTALVDNVYATVTFAGSFDDGSLGEYNDEDSLTVNFNNLYPGSYGVADIIIKNNSTMRVKLANSIDVDLSGDQSLIDDSDVIVRAGTDVNSPNAIVLNKTIVNGKVTALSVPTAAQPFELEPGDSMVIQVFTEMKREDTNSENKSMNMTITPIFEQYNAN